jgi:hypothetical protein
MKYVIGTKGNGLYYPIVFPEEMSHDLVAESLRSIHAEVMSAGFVYKVVGRWKIAEQRSRSLDLGPGPKDEIILSLFLRTGAAGVSLMNLLFLGGRDFAGELEKTEGLGKCNNTK